MPHRLELPAWVFTDKPLFPTRPGREVVREIKAHIAQFGTPHLWRGHSHSKPQQGVRIVYLDTFHLPKSHSGKGNDDRWAPCPCCHLHYPKYYKNGMIAWFPDQHLIRMLGPQCFRTYNPEGHDSAYGQFLKEKRVRLDTAFLLGHLHLLPECIRVTARAIEVATAVDAVGTHLRTKIELMLHIPSFWQHIREGVLRVTETRSETVRLQDGSTLTRDVDHLVSYGPLPGHEMLRPGSHEIARQLRYAMTGFLAIMDFGGVNIDPNTISDKDRRHVARVFERALKKAATSFDELEDVRRLLQPVSISTLAGWGRHPGTPANFYCALDGSSLQLGRNAHEYHRVPIPEHFFGVLPPLPRIRAVQVDDVPDAPLATPGRAEDVA